MTERSNRWVILVLWLKLHFLVPFAFQESMFLPQMGCLILWLPSGFWVCSHCFSPDSIPYHHWTSEKLPGKVLCIVLYHSFCPRASKTKAGWVTRWVYSFHWSHRWPGVAKREHCGYSVISPLKWAFIPSWYFLEKLNIVFQTFTDGQMNCYHPYSLEGTCYFPIGLLLSEKYNRNKSKSPSLGI